MNHITQEVAVELAFRCGALEGQNHGLHKGELLILETDVKALCNAAIQHYIDQQEKKVPAGYGELIKLAAWLVSPDPTYYFDLLEENTHIGHRQFNKAQEETHDVLRRKSIEIRKIADALAAAPTGEK